MVRIISSMANYKQLSRSRLELFLECQRCFWLLMNKKIGRPKPFPYTINSAIDRLLKKEFDEHRTGGTAHEIIKKYKIDAIPFDHPDINRWRHTRSGIRFEHEASGFLVYGAVDDVWKGSDDKLIVVDYKATGAKEHKIQKSYKRQMEIYQWLLRKNDFEVSDRGYFLFAKVDQEQGFGGGKLSFELLLEPCDGNNEWVETAIIDAKNCLEGDIPDPGSECDFCRWKIAQDNI